MPKSNPVCIKVYIDNAGKEHKSLPADPSTIKELQFRFLDEAKTVRSYIPSEYTKAMRKAFEFFGGSECLGNSYAGAKGDVASAIANWDARNGTIMADAWTARTGGGAGAKSDSILAEAMLAYFADVKKTKAKDGQTIDAAWVRSYLLAEDVDDNEAKETRSERTKSWKANPDVKVHYERIRSEREAAKTSTVAAAAASDI